MAQEFVTARPAALDGLGAMESHDAVVSSISARVKQFYQQQKPFRIYHGATNSTRRSHRRADNTVDTSQLSRVLAVDAAARTALVEPNVPMDLLVAETLRRGLVPPVVMELPGITVGGGFSGTSGESSSFRHGAFDANVKGIEIVLPDGTVARASKTERRDLFWGAASAFGTLGVVTLLELQLKDAKEYVRLEYSLASGAADMLGRIEEECAKDSNDYVDAIVFAMDTAVVCAGRLADDLPEDTKPVRFTRRGDPWFYTRARDVVKQLKKKHQHQQQQPGSTTTTTVTDFVPLEDYLFRYDRGGFWTAVYAFRYFLTPFNRVTRYVLDPLMHAREMYRAVHKSGLADYYMVQDVGVPYDRVAEFQAWLDEELHIYPLWICPLRIRRDDPGSGHGLHSSFADPATAVNLMNFGVWGGVRGSRARVVEKNRALERKVQELGGKKWLYAHAYYTEEEFWAHYDRASYDALRARYGAAYLPSVYDKVRVDVEGEEAARAATWRTRARAAVWDLWPLAGLRGFYSAVKGGDYLLQKQKKKIKKKKMMKRQEEEKENGGGSQEVTEATETKT